MSSNENKKSTEEPFYHPPTESLLSFENFDKFFDDFITRKWPRLLDWKMPSAYERESRKINMADDKENLETLANGQTITNRTATKTEQEEDWRIG